MCIYIYIYIYIIFQPRITVLNKIVHSATDKSYYITPLDNHLKVTPNCAELTLHQYRWHIYRYTVQFFYATTQHQTPITVFNKIEHGATDKFYYIMPLDIWSWTKLRRHNTCIDYHLSPYELLYSVVFLLYHPAPHTHSHTAKEGH